MWSKIKMICWFCKKDNHKLCMKNIPIRDKSDGSHDCSFDTEIITCECKHLDKTVNPHD